MRRAAIQNGDHRARCFVIDATEEQLLLFDKGGTGRIVFEIGAALSGMPEWRDGLGAARIAECERAEKMYQQWCDAAKRGIMCWLWLSRIEGVCKDVRLTIASLIWDERAAWSELMSSANQVV
jgi:hypothetical protein